MLELVPTSYKVGTKLVQSWYKVDTKLVQSWPEMTYHSRWGGFHGIHWCVCFFGCGRFSNTAVRIMTTGRCTNTTVCRIITTGRLINTVADRSFVPVFFVLLSVVILEFFFWVELISGLALMIISQDLSVISAFWIHFNTASTFPIIHLCYW